MAERCAVIGVGQTKHDAKRIDVSQVGLVREAALRALEDAGLGWTDIDAVVIGKAPDLFEGVMMPELFLADALGCTGKPMLRVHTAGSVGGSTAIVAASLVEAGVHQRVLTVAYEKQSESNAMWALSIKIPFRQAVVAGAGGFFAPLIRSYMRRSHAPEDTGIRVALKDRLNALKNPYAHLKFPGVDFEQVESSPMLWDPIRFMETCPSSDGACAMVLGSEAAAKRVKRPPAWVHATRIAVTWLTVIAVFAWFVAGHGGALPGPYTIVVVLTWVLSELLAAGTFLFVARFVEIDGPGWTFRLQSVGVTLLRALAGLAVGAGIRRRAG